MNQLRTCISCRIIKPQNELIRLAIDKDNQVVTDEKLNLGGRGAYVCNETCMKKAVESRVLSRSFRKKVALGNF